MDYLDSKCLESLMIEDYHLSIANEGFGDFLKNIGQKFVAILKFFGRMIGNFIKFLKGLFNKKGDNGGSDSSSGSSKSSSKSSGSKSKGISDEDANKWAKALADKTNAAFNARNHNLVVFLAKVVTKISNVSSTLNYSGKIISNISKVGPSKLAEDIESLKKYY